MFRIEYFDQITEFLTLNEYGVLYYHEILMSYDEPMLFTCKTKGDHNFLVNSIENNVNNKVWAIVPISRKRLLQGLKGNLSIYELMKYPETGFIFLYSEDLHNSNENHYERISSENITDYLLPSEDSYETFIPSQELVPFKNNTLDASKEENRSIIDLQISRMRLKSHDMPAFIASAVIGTLNDLFKVFLTATGKSNDQELLLTGNMAPGSVILRFKIEDNNLFPEYDASKDAFENIIELLSVKDNEEYIKQVFKKYQIKKTEQITNFLDNLTKSDLCLKIDFASIDKVYSNSINSYEARNLSNFFKKDILESEENIDIEGVFYSYNAEKKLIWFEFNDGVDQKEKTIKASLHDTLHQTKILIPSKKHASFKKTIKKNSITDKLTEEYILLSFID